VAEHRGGALTRQDHRALATWAAECAEHVLSVTWPDKEDRRPFNAVRQARSWATG